MGEPLPPVTRPFRLDVDALVRLLREAGLPAEGVAEGLDGYLVARVGERIVGAVGVEYAGAAALVRALAVAAPWRGRGLGEALVEAALADARRRGAERALVPARCAGEYFARLGFRPLAPDAAPAGGEDSPEVRRAGGAEAAYLVRPLA